MANYRRQVAEVHVEDRLMEYIARIVNQTRNNRNLMVGCFTARLLGHIDGVQGQSRHQRTRFHYAEDIKYMALPVLRHRIQLTPESEMEGGNPDRAVAEILSRIEVPR